MHCLLCLCISPAISCCAPARNNPTVLRFQETGNKGSMAIAYGFKARLQRPGTCILNTALQRGVSREMAEGWRWLFLPYAE